MIIAPSVLSFDYTDFENQIRKLNFNSEWLHFDVMDGHFVPNLTFGPDILKAFRKSSPLFLDVHIMVDDPFYYADIFSKSGADSITFHFEALDGDIDKCKELISIIKSKYIKAGISINPDTPVEVLEPLLKDVDLVLIMSVYPGFGGQSFNSNAYDKIAFLNEYRSSNNLNYLIEVDGGVNDKNAHKLSKCGADILVSGSFIFNGDIQTNIDKLKHASEL